MTDLSPQDQDLLDEVKKRVEHFESTLGVFYRDGLWARMDRLYHNYTRMRKALRDTTGRDRDAVYADARKKFGAELFIPHSFAIVETVLPALLSNRPRILVLPRNEASDRNVEYMRALLDAQSEGIDLELKLQSVIKSGLMYGLGVGKAYWRRHEQVRPTREPASWVLRKLGHEYAAGTCVEPLFDDPTFEHVPVTDFFWDAFAANIDTARWAAHRTWRDTAYVKARLADEKGWAQMPLTPEDIENSNGSADRYRKSVAGSFEAQAIPIPNPQGQREQDIHEVIEYHDRGRIITILDRQWVVSVVASEAWYGRLPFHVYRPTEVLNQMVGKGEIEPNEDMQGEMNEIRTNRRWSDLISQQPVLFVQEGIVEIDKIRVGPGEINTVNGDPRDLIYPLEIKGPGSSSYRETAEIAADIVRTSGISDTFAGGEAGSQATATGVQLELARASARIQLKTRRAEIELIKPLASHWAALNQWHITGEKTVRTPAPPVMGEPERRWNWFTLTPAELAGEFEFQVEGGSTAPENVPQRRQDAQIKMTLMSSPLGQMFDPRQMAISILEDLALKNPEGRLQDPMIIPAATLDVAIQHLAELGMDPNLARQVMELSLHEVQAAQDDAASGTDHGEGGQPPPGDEQPPQDQQQAA
jgi:hypothetical protein